MTPAAPNEETPLLSGQQTSAVGTTAAPEPEVATLDGPPNRGSRAQGTEGKTRTSKVPKKTPLPWAQFSVVMFSQLAEPLTSQVIYPVSSSTPAEKVSGNGMLNGSSFFP